jgi:hypothetical protein
MRSSPPHNASWMRRAAMPTTVQSPQGRQVLDDLFRYVACVAETPFANLVIDVRNFTTLSSECGQSALRSRGSELSGFQ